MFARALVNSIPFGYFACCSDSVVESVSANIGITESGNDGNNIAAKAAVCATAHAAGSVADIVVAYFVANAAASVVAYISSGVGVGDVPRFSNIFETSAIASVVITSTASFATNFAERVV